MPLPLLLLELSEIAHSQSAGLRSISFVVQWSLKCHVYAVPVGASLLAKAAAHSTSQSPEPAHSRAGSLPHLDLLHIWIFVLEQSHEQRSLFLKNRQPEKRCRLRLRTASRASDRLRDLSRWSRSNRCSRG
ncbi:hypothetical protein PspCFBP13508_03550 [Pseudomonas sp. CFBP13508]|nr:hypothetical protein PspCFBP13508_03550 [Pseudomonas sp. CFBP13508]